MMPARPAARIIHAAIAAMLLAGLVISFCPEAAEASSREDYHKIQRDLRQQKKKLAEATKVEKAVVTDIRRVDSQISDIEDQMNSTKKQISSLRGNINTLEQSIAAAQESLDQQRERLRSRLRTMQRINDSKEIMLMLISNEDPSTLLRVSRSLGDISRRYYTSIEGFRAELLKLGEQKRKLAGYMGNLRSEEKSLSNLETQARERKKEKEQLLANVRKEKDSYRQMISDLKEESERIQKVIRDAERREATSRKKGSQKGRLQKKSESAPEPLPSDSAFTKLKGTLPWPMQGRVAIKYGSQIDPVFNLPVFRSGIHIKGAAGTRVTAVAEGRVVYAAEFKNYGKMVVVSHGGGYHTLYANLSKIFSANDAIIKEDEPVGEAGDSAALGTTGLYFEIRYKGKPLDPQQWLRRSGG